MGDNQDSSGQGPESVSRGLQPVEAQRVLEWIRQMRMATLYPRREDLEDWIITAKELLESIPPGPMWQAAVGYIEGMISMYNRRFGDEIAILPPAEVPFEDTPFPPLV